MKKNKHSLLSMNFDLVRELNESSNKIFGGAPGDPCTCGCHHANNGGSSTCDNSSANSLLGKTSVGGGQGCSFANHEEHQFFMGCN